MSVHQRFKFAEVTNQPVQKRRTLSPARAAAKRGSVVKKAIQGIENFQPESAVKSSPARRPRFAEGVVSPQPGALGQVAGKSVRKVEPREPPSPNQQVPASLLASSEEHARGLQSLNEQLRDELVAAEIKADAADSSRLSLEEFLNSERDQANAEITRLNQAIDTLRVHVQEAEAKVLKATSDKRKGLTRQDLIQMNADNASAMARAIDSSVKTMADAQLEYIRLLVQHASAVLQASENNE